MTVSTTLRDVIGLDNALPALSASTLILIDLQNTYRTGVMALPDAERALDSAARLLERARAAGTSVIHVINDGGEGTPYDIRAEIGQIAPQVAPQDGEPVVVKGFPNSFHETSLLETLRGLEAGPDLVLAGFMTHMCVQFTAQGAFNLGYRPTVVAEACATRSLPGVEGTTIAAEALHAAALTTIGDLFGPVAANVADLPA
ncbi:cysteine hydrolase family protein [Nonomuraea gerenzanensis]|uniref:Isochorismatase n=1 Tax=Nonomuraea gerenzanensis TaxID=93944 RepID=A0A1M4EKR7_9ACTN|nr:cysteine hydrolase family protein [Nonomuraea gerenzanensis]UBU11009.1 cysteine hydrolase [Nonomuraea gerenzanensis]SBO99462.1 Isochorismatase [Nonomuraea gerenzanensis]